MIEIRIHGRGGQGAVTTGQLLALAAFYDNKYSQTFPMFGVERTGAPVEAFTRIDDEFIHLRSQVYHPDVVIVLDPTLMDAIDITKGLKPGSTIIINTNLCAVDLKIKSDFKVICTDVTAVANQVMGRPIVNTGMLGAFSKATKLVSLNSLKRAIDEKFLGSKGQKVADMNKQVIEKVYEMTNNG